MDANEQLWANVLDDPPQENLRPITIEMMEKVLRVLDYSPEGILVVTTCNGHVVEERRY